MAFPAPQFDGYDESFAAAMLASGDHGGGLPAYLGVRTEAVGAGRMVAAFDVRPELLTPFGSLHGGAVSALVDHVLGAVLYPVIERGAWAATTEFKVNFLAPVRDGTVAATSTVVSLTKRSAVVRIEVTNGERAVALAQGTVTIMPPRPGSPAAGATP